MAEVPLERTALSKQELRDALYTGHELAFGSPPAGGRLGYAWSVARLETGGRGINHNLGNIKCFEPCVAAGHDWVDISPILKEGSSEPPIQRAYATAAEGARDWWNLLAKPRYDGVLELADEGRAYEAAYLMGERGYYGAPKDRYSSAVDKLYREFVQLWPGSPAPPTQPDAEPQAPSVMQRIGGLLIGIFAGWTGRRFFKHRER